MHLFLLWSNLANIPAYIHDSENFWSNAPTVNIRSRSNVSDHLRSFFADPVTWTALGLGGVFLLWQRGGPGRVLAEVSDVIGRGKILTHGSYDSTLGIVTDTPANLVAAASARMGQDISQDVYSLARMIRSEGATQGDIRAHVALNDLAALGWSSLKYLLTYSTDAKRRGFYGAQYSRAVPPVYPNANVRRYSTREDPYEADVLTALRVITDHAAGIDPSNGATKFVDKKSMGGAQQGTGSFSSLDARWKADGYLAYTLPEYGDDLVFYKRA